MAQNTTDEYRKFRYYEGVCSSSDFIKELAKVLSFGVKSDPKKDIDGTIIEEAVPLIVKNWDIVYPMVNKDFPLYEQLNSRDKYDDEVHGVSTIGQANYFAKLLNQIDQIDDMVVLRTTTTPKEIKSSEADDLSVSEDTDQPSTTMYVQFWKPKYLANPEEYPLDAEMHGLIPQLITKEMYREARKSTAAVIYDLAQLKDSVKVESNGLGKLVSVQLKNEYVDALSVPYSYTKLFDPTLGVLNGLAAIFGETSREDVIPEPTITNRVTSCVIPKAYLNSIKQTNLALYNFLFEICGLRTTFTAADYDLIEEMEMMITAVGSSDNLEYYITLSFIKQVEIFTIAGNPAYTRLDVKNEYGHVGLEDLKPELYSEGRYVPLPNQYLSEFSKEYVEFNSENPLKFCLDKVKDETVLYGTIVLRFNYDKDLDYTDLSSLQITDSVALENNHYCLVRMFDNPNSDFSGPEPNIEDAKGNITATNSHTSPWSKLSWYQDFEEIMVDDIDEDVSVTSVTDGTLLVPLETAGLTSDTRISYWVNTNNDRFSLIVMGNPALDYEKDRHLISSCYVGRIESFDNSINDVSGNFALYTSSSTTPCKTVMTAHDTQYHINMDFNNDYFQESATGLKTEFPDKYPRATGQSSNIEAYVDYSKKIGGEQKCSKISENGFDIYYITITGNKFFNENEQPRYMILNSDRQPQELGRTFDDKPLYYGEVAYRDFIYGSSDSRSNQIMIYLPRLTASDVEKENLTVYFNFGYYEEKFVINSGITRDIFGNVVGIETIDDYGKNTSDGVTSVSMYHTRSKAFYQKHHFLFATTEEYMSKVMYGKSSYTGEYYADRIKITHGNDGPRGILSDTLVIDSSSLYPKDELVINKDFEKDPNELEETFTYFPVTAPFSPLADGPNARYGVALKKAEKEPVYTDNKKILNIARNELNAIMTNNTVVDVDTILPSQTKSGCKIYWKVLEDSNWIEAETGEQIVCTFADETKTFTGRKYDANNVDIVVDGFKQGNGDSAPALVTFDISQGSEKTADFLSKVKLAPHDSEYAVPSSVTGLLYGYSDTRLTTLRGDTALTYIIDDGTETDNIHEYPYKECFVDISHTIDLSGIVNGSNKITEEFEQDIYNAHPSKYLNLFFVEDGAEEIAQDEDENSIYNKVVKAFASVPLCVEDWAENFTPAGSYYALLQYPCTVTAYTTGVTNSNEQGIFHNSSIYGRYEFNYVPYNADLVISTQNMNGAVTVMASNYTLNETLTNTNQRITIAAAKVIDDLYVNIAKS